MSELSREQPRSPHGNPEKSFASSLEPADELAAIEDLFNQIDSCQQAFVQELEQTEKTCAEQAARISRLEAQLATLTGERDAAAKEMVVAQQSAMELQQQVNAQSETLQQAQKARDQLTARISSLEAQLKALTGQRDSTIAGLHRLRHLARATEHAS